jgi:hypothetical protein
MSFLLRTALKSFTPTSITLPRSSMMTTQFAKGALDLDLQNVQLIGVAAMSSNSNVKAQDVPVRSLL